MMSYLLYEVPASYDGIFVPSVAVAIGTVKAAVKRPYLSTVNLVALTVSLEAFPVTDVRDSVLYEPTTTAVSARSMNGF